MPLWVTFALIGAVLTALSSVIDKYVLSKWMTDAVGSYFVFAMLELLFGVVVFVALGFPILPWPAALLAASTGAVFSLSVYFYFRAIQVGEVSRLVPLYDLSPLIVATFAAVFLGEIFSPLKYLGVFLLIVGSLLLSVHKLRGWHVGRGVGWMLLSVGVIAVGAIVSKEALGVAQPWVIFAYGKLGTILVALPSARGGLSALRKAVRQYGRTVLVYTGLSELLTATTTIFFLFAASTGYITLVNALIQTNPFFLLIFTTLLSLYRPKVLKEEFGGHLLLRKAAAMILMFVGAGLVVR